MKPKHSIRPNQVATLGITLLLVTPVVHSQIQDTYQTAAVFAQTDGNTRRAMDVATRANVADVAETRKTEEEKGDARRDKEAARRAKEASEKNEQADDPREDGKPAAPAKAPESAPKRPSDESAEPANSEADVKPDAPARSQGRRETAPGTKERTDRPAREPREVRELKERPATPATPATPLAPPAVENKPPVDMPVVPSESLKPREETKLRDRNAVPAKDEMPELAPVKPEERKSAEIPATEPERVAEKEVAEVTREVQRDLDQRKTRIGGREEAQALINDILGAESRISRAEITREERFRPRFERQHPGDQQRRPEVSPDQRRAATTYFQERLRGREVDGPPPEFFGRSPHHGNNPRVEERVVERVEFVRPRYLNDGRRYVHFDSRASIPAILMAAQAMNQVRFQPTREIAPMFHDRQDGSTAQAVALPPENYRSENSWVVSYPVDEKSMISSEAILFLQGSTQFSDPYSYEVIGVMADAMKAMPGEDRFVIEGHASAEGSYDSNMALSQLRAEHIVREIVRRGVSPYRLLPVGYGESEARRSADAAETLRSQDRRVVVFRMKPEAIAKR